MTGIAAPRHPAIASFSRRTLLGAAAASSVVIATGLPTIAKAGGTTANTYFVIAPSPELGAQETAAIYATPGIVGVHIGLPWCDMNPADGVYDFTKFDAILALVPANMQIGINLGAGFAVPPWLASTLEPGDVVNLHMPIQPGGRPVKFKFPVPWAQPVVDAYLAAFAAFAAHLDLSRVTGVRVLGTFQSGWVPNLHMLGGAFTVANDTSAECAALWAAAGYRPSFVAGQWLLQVEAIAALFPTSVLTLSPFEPPFAFPWVDDSGTVLSESNSEATVDAMIAQAAAEFGARLHVIDVSFCNLAQRAVFPAAAAAGAALGFQPNTWGHNGACREGPASDPGPGGRLAITSLIANAKSIVQPSKPYIEFHSINLQYLPG